MITQNDPCRMIAKRILGRYLCIATKAAGLPWNEGNEAEVAEIVDDIVDSAVGQMIRQMQPHEYVCSVSDKHGDPRDIDPDLGW
jgi:hypothetical protein